MSEWERDLVVGFLDEGAGRTINKQGKTRMKNWKNRETKKQI
jgi:hypothetical protein